MPDATPVPDAGQPVAAVTVLPLLAACTACAYTVTLAVAFRYSLPMVLLKVTLVRAKTGVLRVRGFSR